ncbi:MAG: 1-acyl-sn-glycerol-3-phosphate acyltransferase [Planctomycetota bacterium]
MQQVIVEEPYEFVPPVYGNTWPNIIQLYLKRYLRTAFGVHSVECREVDRLRATLEAGHGVLLAPNHCRLSDPLTLGILSREIGRHLHAMASWHLFKESWLANFVLRRMGGFSIYREGLDRTAIDTGVEILAAARRPLIVFPEGAISRHNDQVMPLMDGTAFVARTAAKRRAKRKDPAGVVVHPIAIRYFFQGDVEETVKPVLTDLENRLGWFTQEDRPLVDRLRQIGEALLALKEVEYTGASKSGDFYHRAAELIEEVLSKIEQDCGIKEKAVGEVARVKAIRAALLPDMVDRKVTPEERRRRWNLLATSYYLQQMSHYPPKYVRRSVPNIKEHILETVERFEEDFTDHARIHHPMHVVIEVGEAIAVEGRRPRGGEDPIMSGILDQLTEMLTRLSKEADKV